MKSIFGEFGIPETSPTIGVGPQCQNKGVVHALLDQFVTKMKAIGVIYTLVHWDDFGLGRFFGGQRVRPPKRVQFEPQLP